MSHAFYETRCMRFREIRMIGSTRTDALNVRLPVACLAWLDAWPFISIREEVGCEGKIYVVGGGEIGLCERWWMDGWMDGLRDREVVRTRQERTG